MIINKVRAISHIYVHIDPEPVGLVVRVREFSADIGVTLAKDEHIARIDEWMHHTRGQTGLKAVALDLIADSAGPTQVSSVTICMHILTYQRGYHGTCTRGSC